MPASIQVCARPISYLASMSIVVLPKLSFESVHVFLCFFVFLCVLLVPMAHCSGEVCHKKVSAVREKLIDMQCDALAVTALDDIACKSSVPYCCSTPVCS